jgi:hypothetical protein
MIELAEHARYFFTVATLSVLMSERHRKNTRREKYRQISRRTDYRDDLSEQMPSSVSNGGFAPTN